MNNRLIFFFLVAVLMLVACSNEVPDNNSDDFDVSTTEDAEESIGLSGASFARATAFCEQPGQIYTDAAQQTIESRPAMCLPGTTPETLYLTISVEDNLHPVLSGYRQLAASPMTLHLDEISQRGYDEGVESHKRCSWSNYRGYGIFPVGNVSFSYFDAVTIKNLPGVSRISQIRADADTSVEFRNNFPRTEKPIPMDCSVPLSLKAVVTPNWEDGLDENSLPTMISVSVLPDK